jgi:hypothetical protein
MGYLAIRDCFALATFPFPAGRKHVNFTLEGTLADTNKSGLSRHGAVRESNRFRFKKIIDIVEASGDTQEHKKPCAKPAKPGGRGPENALSRMIGLHRAGIHFRDRWAGLPLLSR